ncbi:MAG: hypothetical protein EZS28_011959 [Streblomastix strix]|uniref:Peptidase C14 caspase domain-containing protein n=1 Tax=Streblomastix strix TaxID=222440 RepID=A0A5J4WDJ8_9EUKA|nr:MAG: hypothetical protein EZS28_011959 [Streblomastix strix]
MGDIHSKVYSHEKVKSTIERIQTVGVKSRDFNSPTKDIISPEREADTKPGQERSRKYKTNDPQKARIKKPQDKLSKISFSKIYGRMTDTIGVAKKERQLSFQKPITNLVVGPTVYDPSVDIEDFIPPTNLPTEHIETEAEIYEQKKRWSRFATFMAKPYNYQSRFKKQLQELDSLGCINLERTNRDQIPGLTINYAAALFINPYEGQSHTMHLVPLMDALLMAQVFISRKYRVFYFCDATALEYYKWMDWLVDNVELQLVSYFSGRATQIVDKRRQKKEKDKEKDGLVELLMFQNAKWKAKRDGTEYIESKIRGITQDTLEDVVIYDLIKTKEYPQTRIVLLTDYRYFIDQFLNELPFSGLETKQPLPNTIYVGSGQIVGSAISDDAPKMAFSAGIFASQFSKLLKSNPNININEMNDKINLPQDRQPKLIVVTGDSEYLQKPVIVTMEGDDQELQLNELQPFLEGKKPEQITSIPAVDVPSFVEVAEAAKRWKEFTAEMAKPAPYKSLYMQQLLKLDGMGAINLERLRREQIPPNIIIENCIALFFNPYEGLPHTLEIGPINDGVLMAELFLGKGYNVVYLCDATPHEYYKWMDWLLSNVENELVSYFSGHGTQVPDKTGKEFDGLSEVLVFYNAKKKTASSSVKITPVQGITDETVEDTAMHDLIISKDYPQTRVVLLTDCCHSGTMFNFDETLPLFGKPITPKTKRINIVCVGAALDSQTAKQTVQGSIESGVFTYNFTQLIKSKPESTFKELEEYMVKNIKKYQTIQLTSNDQNNLNKQIVVKVEQAK